MRKYLKYSALTLAFVWLGFGVSCSVDYTDAVPTETSTRNISAPLTRSAATNCNKCGSILSPITGKCPWCDNNHNVAYHCKSCKGRNISGGKCNNCGSDPNWKGLAPCTGMPCSVCGGSGNSGSTGGTGVGPDDDAYPYFDPSYTFLTPDNHWSIPGLPHDTPTGGNMYAIYLTILYTSAASPQTVANQWSGIASIMFKYPKLKASAVKVPGMPTYQMGLNALILCKDQGEAASIFMNTFDKLCPICEIYAVRTECIEWNGQKIYPRQ